MATLQLLSVDDKHPEPPVETANEEDTQLDGGFLAWSQVLVGHLVAFNAWGFINSFGLFQAYYTDTLGLEELRTAWIGSVQNFLTLFVGTLSGRAMDAGLYRSTVFVGALLQILGVFMTSLSTQYWQLFLSQGLCQGLGNGIVFTPTLALVSTYFRRKRAFAVAGMTTGTATGGVIFPLVAQQLLGKIGFAWTVRVMGFIILGNSIIILALARPRTHVQKQQGPIVEISQLADPWFSFFAIGLVFALMGLYFGYDYLNSFAIDVTHASAETSLNLLLVVNALGVPGRIIPALIADNLIGPLNSLIIVVAITGAMMFAWIGITIIPGLWALAVLYGFFGAGIQSLFPPALAKAKTDPSKFGVRMGMVCSLMSIGTLCGPPIAGALIQRDQGSYLYAQIFSGTVMALGAVLLVGPRVLSVGWKINRRV